jgi:hypothetical protein
MNHEECFLAGFAVGFVLCAVILLLVWRFA